MPLVACDAIAVGQVNMTVAQLPSPGRCEQENNCVKTAVRDVTRSPDGVSVRIAGALRVVLGWAAKLVWPDLQQELRDSRDGAVLD